MQSLGYTFGPKEAVGWIRMPLILGIVGPSGTARLTPSRIADAPRRSRNSSDRTTVPTTAPSQAHSRHAKRDEATQSSSDAQPKTPAHQSTSGGEASEQATEPNQKGDPHDDFRVAVGTTCVMLTLIGH